jgi:hypothetical protein
MSDTIDREPAGAMQKFILTSEEKRVVLFILIAFFLGLAVKHYRDTHPHPITPPSKKAYRSHIFQPSRGPTNTGSTFESPVPALTPAGTRAREATPP